MSSKVARALLHALITVARETKLPGTELVENNAINLIKSCEECTAMLEKARKLKIHIAALMNGYEKNTNEDPKGIERAQHELNNIKKDLDAIDSQRASFIASFKTMKEEDVIADNPLRPSASVQCTIDHAPLFQHLEKEIIGYYNAQKPTLTHIHDVVDYMNLSMKTLRAMMKGDSPVAHPGPTKDAPVFDLVSACTFLKIYQPASYDTLTKEQVAVLDAEERNLEEILLRTTEPSKDILNAIFTLGWYQSSTQPSTRIISHGILLARQRPEEYQDNLGHILMCHGTISDRLNHYEEAKRYYKDARQIFLSTSNIKQAAYCLLACGVTNQAAIISSDISLATKVESEFETIHEKRGVAYTSLFRGIDACQCRDAGNALGHLWHAQDMFTELHDVLGCAMSLDAIALCHYWKEDFVEAKASSELAVQALSHREPLHRHMLIDVLLQMGCIENALGDYASALRTLERCLGQAKIFGAPLLMGLTLEEMGISWSQLGEREKAQKAFREALKIYPIIQNRMDKDRCKYWRKKTSYPNIIPNDREWNAIRRTYPPTVLQRFRIMLPS